MPRESNSREVATQTVEVEDASIGNDTMSYPPHLSYPAYALYRSGLPPPTQPPISTSQRKSTRDGAMHYQHDAMPPLPIPSPLMYPPTAPYQYPYQYPYYPPSPYAPYGGPSPSPYYMYPTPPPPAFGATATTVPHANSQGVNMVSFMEKIEHIENLLSEIKMRQDVSLGQHSVGPSMDGVGRNTMSPNDRTPARRSHHTVRMHRSKNAPEGIVMTGDDELDLEPVEVMDDNADNRVVRFSDEVEYNPDESRNDMERAFEQDSMAAIMTAPTPTPARRLKQERTNMWMQFTEQAAKSPFTLSPHDRGGSERPSPMK